MIEQGKFFYSLKERCWKCRKCNLPLKVVPREGMACPNCGEGMIELIAGKNVEKIK